MKNQEFEKFDRAMSELLKVPHSAVKTKLDAEKAAKERRKKRKAKASASDRAASDKG